MFQPATSHGLPLSSRLFASQALTPPLPRQGWDLLPTAAQDGEVEPKKPLLTGSLVGAASPRTADGSSHRHSRLSAFLSFLS